MGETADGILARLMRAYDVHDEATLAIHMGRDMSTVRVWKARDAVPLLVLTNAARATGYSLAWLRGEEGAAEVDTPRMPDDDATRLALSPREAALIQHYRATNEGQRAAAEQLLSTLADSGKPGRRSAKSPANYPPKGGITTVLEVREGTAPWRESTPVRSDTPGAGDGLKLGGAAVLPISSASESRPLVLTIQGGRGQARGYEVIPKYRGVVGAGRGVAGGALSQGLDQAGDMAFAMDWLRDNFGHTSGQLASIQVHGDSMAPTLLSGDTIVIDSGVRRVDVAGIYVIEAHGDRLVKRINRRLDNSLVIMSDNTAYPPEEVSPARIDDIRVLGRMVGRWAR